MEFKGITSNEVQTEKDVLVASCGINEEHPEANISVTMQVYNHADFERTQKAVDEIQPVLKCQAQQK